MPKVEEYVYPHGNFTQEPHCIPGYTGYLPGFGPRRIYQYGKTYGKMTHDIMAKHPIAGERFGKILECSDDIRSNDKRSYDRKSKRELKNGSILRSDMVAGYTDYSGYYAGKDFDMGVTHSRGAHQDLCDLASSKLERLLAERRPKVCDWYSCPKLYPPEAPIVTGYHPPDLHPVCPVPGYTGQVSGYRDSGLGATYGRSAGAVMRERELAECRGLR